MQNEKDKLVKAREFFDTQSPSIQIWIVETILKNHFLELFSLLQEEGRQKK